MVLLDVDARLIHQKIAVVTLRHEDRVDDVVVVEIVAEARRAQLLQ